LTFLALSPQAEAYARKLEEKRLNSPHHIRQIVALSEIYGAAKVERALQDALSFEAFGCECHERRQRVIERRLKAARFPVLKTLEQFRWDWPKKINRMAVQDLFRMEFLKEKSNVVLLGNVGLGKTHLATALGYAACQQVASVLFANAISVINDLSAAQQRGQLKRQLKT